jgi:hypothetical protein
MDEQRLAEIEAQAKALSFAARDHGIPCSDNVIRYGDFDGQALHAAEKNIPDLIVDVKRLRMENHGLRERIQQMERQPAVFED